MRDDMRGVPTCSPAQMKEWQAICTAFAKRYDYKLLFVNETSCGVELKDGSFKHIYIDEMGEYLK